MLNTSHAGSYPLKESEYREESSVGEDVTDLCYHWNRLLLVCPSSRFARASTRLYTTMSSTTKKIKPFSFKISHTPFLPVGYTRILGPEVSSLIFRTDLILEDSPPRKQSALSASPPPGKDFSFMREE